MTTEKDIEAIAALADAVRAVTKEGQADPKRFVDVSRIPLICLSITGIHESLKEIKTMMADLNNRYVSQETFSPVQRIVYGAAGLLMTSVLVALLALLFKK